MPQRFGKIAKEESAAVAIIVAILVTVFIGFLAFVADIGYIAEMRRQLQSAADAAALAGMMEKIKGADDSQVLAVIEDYAQKNDTIDKSIDLEVLGYPETEITDAYVLVSVRKPAKLFFAPAAWFGTSDSQEVYAQAKAKRVYVTGMTNLLPWGVSIIRANKIEATINDTTVALEKFTTPDPDDEDIWEGELPVPLNAGNNGNLVDLTIYNGQDFPQVFTEVAAVTVHGENDAVTNVELQDNILGPGEDTYLYVASTDTPTAKIGNTPYSFAFNTNLNMWEAKIFAPPITETFRTFPVDVSVGNNRFNDAARLIVRNLNSPIENVDLDPLHFSTGGGSTIISVKMRDLEWNKIYNLKVVSDPESGNFNALDFRYIYRQPDYNINVGESDSGADYYDNLLIPGYPGEIEIGDIITTKTGNLSGPQTANYLDTRIAGCSLTYEAWDPTDGSCGRFIAIPIVERIERLTGQSDVIVVAIAEFFLENYVKTADEINITGTFLQYFESGTSSDVPPDSGLYIETVRLDRPRY